MKCKAGVSDYQENACFAFQSFLVAELSSHEVLILPAWLPTYLGYAQ